MTEQWIRMEQPRGRTYHPLVQAAAILLQRGVEQRLISQQALQGWLTESTNAYGLTPPSPWTIRRWAADTPNYPEEMISRGLLDPQELPSRSRSFLRQGILKMEMRQEKAPTDNNAGFGWPGLLLLGAALWWLARRADRAATERSSSAPKPLTLGYRRYGLGRWRPLSPHYR